MFHMLKGHPPLSGVPQADGVHHQPKGTQLIFLPSFTGLP